MISRFLLRWLRDDSLMNAYFRAATRENFY